MLGCLDVDAFFVAVERMKMPSLKDRPVIVGGDPSGRGVVSSASYEARARGVRSAMPSSRAARVCPEAVFLPPDFESYRKVSEKVETILSRYSPFVERASIDEFYFSLRGCERLYGGDFFAVGDRLRREVRHLGVTASVGFALNRPLAKIASDLAKPDGQLILISGEERRFLSPFHVDILPGVGERSADRLHDLGVYTVGDLQAVPREYLTAAFGNAGERLHDGSMGGGCSTLRPRGNRKGISAEETLTEDTTEMTILLHRLFWLTEKSVFRMRKERMSCRSVTVKLRYADFVTETRSRTLTRATDEYRVLRSVVREMFHSLYRRRLRVRLLGVMLSNLSPGRQGSLSHPRRNLLDETVDGIREKHGVRVVSMGGETYGPKSRSGTSRK